MSWAFSNHRTVPYREGFVAGPPSCGTCGPPIPLRGLGEADSPVRFIIGVGVITIALVFLARTIK